MKLPRFRYSGLIPAHAGKTSRTRSSTWNVRAHPRSRGENGAVAWPCRNDSGSSPLTRGKHQPRRLCPEWLGLIPAHAGKTERARRWVAAHRAHPRSRGENPPRGHREGHDRGSSPLTRGKLLGDQEQVSGVGLIPAHAGKTSSSWKWPKSWTAHPRSRGENSTPRRASPWTTGSSPLTRGKPASGPALGQPPGLIPAHAGKTASCEAWCCPSGAHPRSRGENSA